MRLDGRAWIPKSVLTDDHIYNIKASLTVQPRKTSEYTESLPAPIRLFKETDDAIGVPMGWWNRNNSGKHAIKDLTTEGQPFGSCVSDAGVGWSDDPEWAEQLAAKNAVLEHFASVDCGGGIIQAGCAFGKTVTALRIAYDLGQRTLVIVNKGFFTSQWTKRIQEFMPGARIGIVQQNKCEFEDRDIVIAMVHSLAQRDYDPLLYHSFGLIITDECHRIGAPTWTDVIPQFKAKYRLGLSATPRRKDGAEDVFFEHIGPVVYKATGESVSPLVKRIQSTIELKPVRYGSGAAVPVHKLKTSQVEKQISEDMVRNTIYADQVLKAVQAGRKVFVVSNFIEHLYVFQELLEQKLDGAGLGGTTIDWVTGQRFVYRKQSGTDENGEPVYRECERSEGGRRFKVRRKVGKRYEMVWKSRQTTEAQLDAAESAQIILATKQMIEEGFDVQALDVLVPLIPPYDIEQMAGRVRRRCKPSKSKCESMCPWRAGSCEGKPRPIILEPVDVGVHKMERRHDARMKFYAEIGAFDG